MALALVAVGCSGGRDPVRGFGGDGEYQGPGVDGPFGGPDNGSFTTATSTMIALCTDACAHVHAADCDAAPEHLTGQCEQECSGDPAHASGPCSDELAALYQCTIDADVTCSTSVTNEPVVEGCASETNALSECNAPGSGCTASPESDDVCFSVGFSHFFFCTSGTAPPPGCLSVSAEAVCCP